MPIRKQTSGAQGNASRTGRRSGALGVLLASALAAASCFLVPLAGADDLEDQQARLQEEAREVQSSLEFLDGRIAESAAELVVYQGRLPGAQQELLSAQGRVVSATREVEALASRVDAAQQNKAKITEQIEDDKGKVEETRKLIGQIATQAYKTGGVPTDLSLFFGSSGGSLTNSMGLMDQAMRSQNTALEKLTQQNAANVNAEARLAAVEAEIEDLKAKADAALAQEQQARDEAAQKKAAVDKLIADTTRLNKELEAEKPAIQRQIAQNQEQQDKVAADIQERDRKLREAWEAEQRRIAEEKARAAAIEAGKTQEQAASQAEEAASTFVPEQGSPSAFGLVHPFSGIPITSGFGWRATPPGTIDFYGTGGYMHTGIDFGAACGTPVYAAAAGEVTVGGWTTGGGGNTVMLSHGVVEGNSLTTVYYHNTSVTVSPGQTVSQGQLIAYSGTSGNSTGCHAHFETWLNGTPVDPMGLL